MDSKKNSVNLFEKNHLLLDFLVVVSFSVVAAPLWMFLHFWSFLILAILLINLLIFVSHYKNVSTPIVNTLVAWEYKRIRAGLHLNKNIHRFSYFFELNYFKFLHHLALLFGSTWDNYGLLIDWNQADADDVAKKYFQEQLGLKWQVKEKSLKEFSSLFKGQKKQALKFSAWGSFVLIAAIVVSSGIFAFQSSASTFGWIQNNWSGGASTVAVAAHPGNKTGWNNYYFKDGTVEASSSVSINSTTTAPIVYTSDSDFSSNTSNNAYVSGGSIIMLKPISITAIPGVAAPIKDAIPVTVVTATAQFTGTVAWSPVNNPFLVGQIYTATITLTPTAGYTLAGVAANSFTVAGATSVSNPVNSGVITAVFPAAPTTINIAAIPGVTAPVKNATPVTVTTATAQYTGTVTWSPVNNPFDAGTVYTATITLTPTSGFTLTGVGANFFTITGATTVANPANSGVVTAVFPATTLAVGDNYQGGKVAYIFISGDTGYVAGQVHGLIAATADQSAGIQWNNSGFAPATGATGLAIGTGLVNTNLIIAAQGAVATNYAAGLARAYNGGGYNDWYLPSINELIKLSTNRAAIGGFNSTTYYWSSTQDAGATAYDLYWPNGTAYIMGTQNVYPIRAIRSF
jgi:hypothetical protein